MPPCSCLQELAYNFPGPNDLYLCLNKENDCSEEGEVEYWYGHPSSPIPQDCENDECETIQSGGRSTANVPGHGLDLVGGKAWDMFRAGLESAARTMPGLEFGMPTYHVIPRSSLPASVKAAGDLTVMAIPVVAHAKRSRIDGRTYYLCVQIDSAVGQSQTPAAFDKCKAGHGSKLKVDYRVNGELRKGIVWLKN
jgi:hypothetical protein